MCTRSDSNIYNSLPFFAVKVPVDYNMTAVLDTVIPTGLKNTLNVVVFVATSPINNYYFENA